MICRFSVTKWKLEQSFKHLNLHRAACWSITHPWIEKRERPLFLSPSVALFRVKIFVSIPKNVQVVLRRKETPRWMTNPSLWHSFGAVRSHELERAQGSGEGRIACKIGVPRKINTLLYLQCLNVSFSHAHKTNLTGTVS